MGLLYLTLPNVHSTFIPTKFTVTHFTSLNFKTKSLHINQVSSLHINALHITSLIYTQFPLLNPISINNNNDNNNNRVLYHFCAARQPQGQLPRQHTNIRKIQKYVLKPQPVGQLRDRTKRLKYKNLRQST